jgi:hypothetical protein
MGHSVATEDNKSRIVTTKAAMIFALIIIGLLIATANFIQVMGHSDDHGAGHGAAHGTEAGHDAHGEAQGATDDHDHDHANAPTQGDTEPEADAPPITTPTEGGAPGAAR